MIGTGQIVLDDDIVLAHFTHLSPRSVRASYPGEVTSHSHGLALARDIAAILRTFTRGFVKSETRTVARCLVVPFRWRSMKKQ